MYSIFKRQRTKNGICFSDRSTRNRLDPKHKAEKHSDYRRQQPLTCYCMLENTRKQPVVVYNSIYAISMLKTVWGFVGWVFYHIHLTATRCCNDTPAATEDTTVQTTDKGCWHNNLYDRYDVTSSLASQLTPCLRQRRGWSGRDGPATWTASQTIVLKTYEYSPTHKFTFQLTCFFNLL